jgi:hypothetical protein
MERYPPFVPLYQRKAIKSRDVSAEIEVLRPESDGKTIVIIHRALPFNSAVRRPLIPIPAN